MLSLAYMLCALEVFKGCSFYWLMRDRYELVGKEMSKGIRRRAFSC